MQETMNVQAREPEIQSQEVVVLYEGESADPSTTQGKRIVEMPKQRPLWFNSTLLTKVVPKKAAEWVWKFFFTRFHPAWQSSNLITIDASNLRLIVGFQS